MSTTFLVIYLPLILRNSPAFMRPKSCGRTGFSENHSESDHLLHFPLKRLGEPEEIARTIEFLASSKSSHITGVTTSIDGEALSAPFSLSTVGD